jgi:hypothetical protein
VTFFVDGTQANQTGTWRSYDLNVVDLALFVPAPAPPAPTPGVPKPPSAGTGLSQGTSGVLWLALLVMGASVLLGGTAMAGHSRQAVVASPLRQAGSMEAAAVAPIEVRPTTLPNEARKPAQGWLAVVAVGAVAVGVTVLVARKRR